MKAAEVYYSGYAGNYEGSPGNHAGRHAVVQHQIRDDVDPASVAWSACAGELQEGDRMMLRVFDAALSVCKVPDAGAVDLSRELTFAGVTDEEVSLVCPTASVPECALEREDGWRAFRIEGVLDFSLTGVLAGLSAALAEAGVAIFAVSTYNTDYVLVKEENLARALDALQAAGYEVGFEALHRAR